MNKLNDDIKKIYDQCIKNVYIMRDNSIDSSKIISNVIASYTFKIASDEDKLFILTCLTFFNEFNLFVELLANNSFLNSVPGMKDFINKMFEIYDFITEFLEKVINDDKCLFINFDFLLSYECLKKDLVDFMSKKYHLSNYDKEGINRIQYYLDRMIDNNVDYRKRKYAELRSKEIFNRIKDSY